MPFNTKQFKNIFIAVFVLFTVIININPTIAYAASSTIGVVNYQQLINQHPDAVSAQSVMNAAVKQAQDDFNAKAANMSDQEKQSYYQQLQQGLQVKQQELLGAIRDKVNAAVKEVAEAKGLTIVIDKSVDIYGGQDITDDVLKKITRK